MNEVTKIHLGRQAFTISIDAHHTLRSYLDEIKKQVGDKEVIEEIELRMAELLIEHGIDTNKVILPIDVDYIKEQLGSPNDFKEDLEDTSAVVSKTENKKLFRDTEKALIAGVSAGLAEYFGLDILIVRILFVILTLITVGWAILFYIVLWLLIPEAKTTSDKLLMAGRPVTVNSLKDIVERADVKSAVNRANSVLVKPINTLFRIILKIVGLGFMLFGLSVIFGLIGGEAYIIVNNTNIGRYNIFPIGFREHLLLDIVALVIGLIALFIIFFGIAIFRRKWPIRTWITGVLIGIIMIGLAVGGALTAAVYPGVRNLYNANTHTVVRNLSPFANVNLVNAQGVNLYSVISTKSYVVFSYYGHPNLSNINIYVKNGTLVIDSSQFNERRNCSTICIPNSYNMSITIYSPSAYQITGALDTAPNSPMMPYQPKVFN
jgi:phage shock protein PspC (stress-responsive transcriptional regulator)